MRKLNVGLPVGFALTLALAVASATALASGPGLGNLAYTGAEHMQRITTLTSPAGHGVVSMLDGYLFVPFSNDGNAGGGGFDVYDVANPRQPGFVARIANAATEPLLEPHLYGFYVTPSATYLAYPTRDGVSIWDVSDVLAPALVSTLTLPGLGTSGYDGIPWGVFWQAPYLFVGATNQGLYVVDTSDLNAPTQIAHLPTSQMGGFRVGMVYALGNLLVATGVDAAGIATLDISDPAAPQLLTARSDLPQTYASSYFAGQVYGAGTNGSIIPIDASNPTQLTELPGWPAGLGPGGYSSIQDEFLFGGFSTGIAKFVRSTGALVGTASSGINGRDEDFATVLGNVVFAGSDHHGGSALIVHDTAPDTRAPQVVEVQPPDGANAQPLTTRIGVRFSDEIEIESLDSTSLLVREAGGSSPIDGRYSVQNGFVSFAPAAPLLPGTSYDVVVVAGGLRDWAGNAISSGITTSFTTNSGQPPPALALDSLSGPTETGASASFSAVAPDAAPGATYAFDFGDGTPPTAFSPNPAAAHTFARPGNYLVTLSAWIDGELIGASGIHVAHQPAANIAPAATSNVVLLEAWNVVATANTDNDSVSLIDRTSLALLAEIPVCRAPTALALSPADELWVVCQDAAQIAVIDLASQSVVREHALPRASRPFGLVFDPGLGHAYVTLQATGQVARILADGSVDKLLAVVESARGIAIRDGGRELWIARFLSADIAGEIARVDVDTFSVLAPVALAIDPGPDTEASGRGLPNYLGPLAISPDDTLGLVPAKKDNIERGGFRDGQALTFENSVRAMLAFVELSPAVEDMTRRVDFNDSALPAVALFSERGNLAYVALQNSRTLAVVDAYSGSVRLTRSLVGLGASGLVLDADNGRLFVHNELSRQLDVYYVAALETLEALEAPLVATLPLVTREKLSADVLRGKRIFNDAADPRLARDRYLSCNGCHSAGDTDARVWDFTARGQGFRRTPSLLGRAGTALGNVHWTGNFDEIQDFEGDVRSAFMGLGLMDEASFLATAAPLGAPKAGLSSDLDALASYVSSLTEARPSPARGADGLLSAAGERGRNLFFAEARCAVCHAGPHYTDGKRHDIGSVQPHSGSNGPEALAGIGFKTPALTGLWERASLLHDGSAANFAELFANTAHGNASSLTPAQQADLAVFLAQIEGPRPTVSNVVPNRYEIARVAQGDFLYVDREDRVETLPPSLAGLTFVRTALEDQGSTGNHAVQFYLSEPARVIVAYDADASQLPPWLTSWSPVPGPLLVYGGGQALALYEKTFPTGNVMLGGNQPAVGVDTMYAVFVERIDPLLPPNPGSGALGAVAYGQVLYTDRGFEIESAPLHMLGMTLVRTANDDKNSTDPSLVEFDLTTPARVLVAFDDRARGLPAWLAGWTLRPGEFIEYAGGNRLRLYERTFDPGTVTLGGNQPAPGAGSMYAVLVAPLAPPTLALDVPALAPLAQLLCAALLLIGGVRRAGRARHARYWPSVSR